MTSLAKVTLLQGPAQNQKFELTISLELLDQLTDIYKKKTAATATKMLPRNSRATAYTTAT